jgi:hypothetical protein
VSELVDVTRALAPLASWPGLEAASRTTLQPGPHDAVLGQYDDLAYSALMPWVFGSTWYDVVIGMRKLDRSQSITLAHSLADVLAALEEAGYAHCDIAAPNVIINLHSSTAHLIDLEDMYIPALPPPDALPAGTEGYDHVTAAAGLWEPAADRFAGAVLIAEIAAWHEPEVRKQADEEHYFEAGEMQQDSARYQLMQRVLTALSPRLSELFDQAWFSADLADCPPLREWHEVLSELHHSVQVAGVVSNWQPLAIPGIQPGDEGVHAKEATPEPEPPAESVEEAGAEEPAEEPAPAPPRRSQPDIQLPHFDPPLTNGQPITPPAASPPTPTPSTDSRPISQPSQPSQPASSGAAGNRSPVKEWRSLDVLPPSDAATSDRRPIVPPAAPMPEVKAEPELEPEPEPEPEPNAVEEYPVDSDTSEEIVAWDAEEEVEYEPEVDEELPAPDDEIPPAHELIIEEEWTEDPEVNLDEDIPPHDGLLKPILDLAYMDDKNRPHLVWSESAAADHYRLQEDEDPAFSDPKEYHVKGEETRWSPGLFWRRSGRLYYRVRAETDDDPGPWSEVIRVRIGRR